MEFTLISGENPIVVTAFAPQKQNGTAIIMSCATGAKQSYFKPFATYLAEHGFLVFTYDYSGIGRSKPNSLKRYNTSASAWGKLDLTTVIDHVTQNYEYNKLLLIGQSIGGQIPGMSPSIIKVDGLINVVSQSGYWNLWPFPLNIGLLFNWYLLKVMTSILGYFPGKKMGIMEDLPKGVALEWATWGLSKDYLFDHVKEANEAYARLKLPLLAYSFSDDTTAPKNTVIALNKKYADCRIQHKHYTPAELQLRSIGHFGFFREKCKMLWDDLIHEINIYF